MSPPPLPPLPPLPRDDVAIDPSLPLTPLQLGMIYESTLAERPWINLEQAIVRFHGEAVDRAALLAGWSRLATRYQALRLRLDWSDPGQPVWRIAAAVAVTLAAEDWTDLPAAQQDTALSDWLAADRTRGVDLTGADGDPRQPRWRLRLFRLGAQGDVLVWTFAHAILDGRSFARLLAEAVAIHDALRQGKPEPAPPPAAPDLSDWMAARAAVDPAPAAHYFRAALAGLTAPDRQGADTVGQGRKRMADGGLAADQTRQLESRAADLGVALSTLVLAAWGLVQARWTGRGDVVCGITLAGRHLLPGDAGTVGCLINTLPLRLCAGPGQTLRGLLAAVRADQLKLRGLAHVSLGDVMGWSGLPGGTRLFDSLVMFERGTLAARIRQAADADTPQGRRFEVLEEGALPLTLAAFHDEALVLRLEYDPAGVPQAVAERMLRHVERALTAMATLPPDCDLLRIDMLLPTETAALLTLGRPDQAQDQGAQSCVAARFEAQVALAPGRPALRCLGTGQAMDFAALQTAADRVAMALQGRGIGAGDLVAICLPREGTFVAVLLGVLKTGAAFMPMDPTSPDAALAHMLTDSRAGLMIADRAPPAGIAVAVMTSSEAQTEPATSPATADRSATRLAYVIYTSGSTGAPKGVMVSHASLGAHAAAIRRAYALTPADRVLQFASLSFDVSIEEIVPTLLSGAELVLRSPDMSESVPAFLEAVARARITVLNLPTAFWHLLVDHLDATGTGLPASVRLVIAGGERIAPQALARWMAMVPDVRWLNGYGPTEATITATVFEPRRPWSATEEVPVGRPLGHAVACVLAPDGSLAPQGAAGELWLAGPCVAMGYLHRPDLTADRFSPDPHAVGRGGRRYRTGDRARWRSDGTLDFLGRADREVKLRGFRTDLGGVERSLEQDPAVARALVAVDGAGRAQARLLAWVVLAPGSDDGAWRDRIAARLPAPLLPQIVVVPDFPQTAGGKVDLAALPRPKDHKPATDAIPPDSTTARLCRVFADVLEIGAVNPDLSFYDAGGHSLLAIRLIGRIEAAFGIRLSVAALHDAPTPRRLAGRLRRAVPQAGSDLTYVVPIQPEGSRPPLYGVHVLGLNEAYYRPLARALGPDQPVFGLTVGLLTADTPIGVRETAALYLDEIRRHRPDGPVCLSAVSLGSYVAFELAQQLRAAGRDVRMLALLDAEGPDGRATLRGWARLGAHLRRLRQSGPAYLSALIRNRVLDLAGRMRRARLVFAQRSGRVRAPHLSIEDFVAANELAVRLYKARPYAGRLTVVRAAESFDSPESLRAGLGWASVAAGGLDLVEVPGDHLSILADANVHHLARALTGALARPLAPAVDRSAQGARAG